MSIIEVEALAKTFRTRERAAGLAGSLRSFVAPRYREREAVKPISFSLEPGELLAFIGPNGAGKSTTIKMLTSISVVVDLDTIFSFGRGQDTFQNPIQFRLYSKNVTNEVTCYRLPVAKTRKGIPDDERCSMVQNILWQRLFTYVCSGSAC